MRNGFVWLAVFAGIVSGASIWLNKLAITGTEPVVFSFFKNIAVAMALIAIIIGIGKLGEIRKLNAKQWKSLILIGIMGGGIPFILFFYGLSMTSAFNAGFIQKTLFVFASVFALVFLREKIGSKTVLAMLGMAFGIILVSGTGFASFGFGDALIGIATVMWAAEIILSKKALGEMSAQTVVFGRMLFGAIIMLAFLIAGGKIGGQALAGIISGNGIFWLAVTAGTLLVYLLLLYNALKHEKVSVVTTILLVGVPITAILSASGRGAPGIIQGAGIFLILAGTAFVLYNSALVQVPKVVQ
ncbi:MAG: DMT family transporter [archaeon]